MNDDELQLAQLLRTATPEPPSEVSLATLQAHRESALVTAPDRSPVRRRAPFIAAAAVAATVAAVVVGVAFAGHDGGSKAPAGSAGPISSAPAPSTSPSTSPSASPSTGSSAPAVYAEQCAASQLSGSIIGRDSGSSHNLVVIGVRNTSPSGCFVKGYPTIVPYGATGLVTATVAYGTSLLTDPGIKQVNLAAGALASFGVEASTGFEGATTTITSLKLFPSDGTDSFTVNAGLTSTGTPTQLGETAFQLAASAASSSPPSSSAPTVGGTPACAATSLTVSSGATDQGAGQIYFTVIVQNSGATACTVTGFPSTVGVFSTTSGSAGQVDATVTHNGDSLGTITLAPGAKASFVFHGANAYEGPTVSIRRLVFELGGGSFTVVLPGAGMSPNGPAGQPVPVDVTAIKAGTER